MKKIFFLMLTLFILSAASMNAQVLIGGDGNSNPDPSAVLELQSSDKGFLLPRVALQSTEDQSTIANPVTGLVVYNTANHQDVTPGHYYYDGNQWVKVRNSIETITKSDLSVELANLIVALAKTGLTSTNNCPSSVTGSNGTYAVADFGAAGCWMVDNSKEGTPSATHYMEGLEGEKPEGLAGYYYTWENAQGACPTDFSLPTPAHAQMLRDVFLTNALALGVWLMGGTQSHPFGGSVAPSDSGWAGWRDRLRMWTTEATTYVVTSDGGWFGTIPTTRDLKLSVRCVKN
jgi:hypothetical protein